ncbi:alpha/beta hydrolase [uncultured Roseobacter sp.]|uniref:alpha/beta fold hydrolase n=1 Tax=uncultured Roseobacter sp. TaxID=114847 RepID=UPI002636ABD7|nr:alpha/beta hydrolase [uncultured Roseobacter sp.]
MVSWEQTPSERAVVAGQHLEYACYGPPPDQAPTLVLLHEGLGCVALWRDFPEKLAAATGMGVLVWSRAGYGRSGPVTLPRPLDYMTREATDGLGPLLDAFAIRRAVLLGHSDGATISAIYAGSVSDLRIRALVLLAPHFFTEPSGLAAIRDAGAEFSDGDLRGKLARYHDDPDMAFLGWHDAWTDPDFTGWDVSDCIDHLRIPVLAIQGEADPYGTLAQIDEIDSRIYSPLERLILPDCGHAPHLERQAETLGAVAEFCERLERLEHADVDTG